jgi:hypothetical protein
MKKGENRIIGRSLECTIKLANEQGAYYSGHVE